MAYKRFTASTRQLKPDPKYHSKLVSKFINCMMLDGKKSVAQKMVYQAMDLAAERIKDATPAEILIKAIENVKPMIQVRSRRGEVSVQAHVTDCCPPGVVSMTFHFAETPTNVLTNSALDPVAKIPETKVCAVHIEKRG